ncbi:MAG: DUF3306 domain-containing protein [Methyloligellaceae bacterium]
MTDDFLRRWSRKKNAHTKRQHQEPKPENKTFPERLIDSQETNATLEEDPTAIQQEQAVNNTNQPIDRHKDKTEGSQEDIDPEQNPAEEFKDVDFDALDFQSDFTRFMGENVPDFIQRKALRKLWGSNPLLANVDGLNDYDDDFTDAAMAVEAIQSAYKVGSGYLTEEEQIEYGMIEKEENETEVEDGDETVETAELSDQNSEEQKPGQVPDSNDPMADVDDQDPDKDATKAT